MEEIQQSQQKIDNFWKYTTVVLIGLIIIGGYIIFFRDNSTTGNAVAPTAGEPAFVSASVDDDAVIGDANAPVTIIEFSDYQCPFCRKFWSETYPSIKSQYIDTGKVKLVFRDFPLTSIHPMAQPAAEAAECVREQGGDSAYFEMHDKIFAEQNILDSGSAAGPVTGTISYTNNDLKDWAKDLGYDIGSCLDSGKFRSEVSKDTSDAQAAGGRGTPYFVVNGKPLSGAQPFAAFQQVIESEL